MKKSFNKKTKRISFERMRLIRGQVTAVTYHYYPEFRKLFALVGGKVKMSYAGAIAEKIFNRTQDESENESAGSMSRAHSA